MLAGTQCSFGDLAEEDDKYQAFVEKFKPKKTTDDCYTPPEIYEVVLDWVVGRYGIDREAVMRPFWPGGDFEREEYPEGCTVVDNPPFSLLAHILDVYLRGGVRFFLFAPTLTAFGSRKHLLEVNHIICHSSITYANGAKVNTSFVTNLDEDGTVVESGWELSDLINAKDDELTRATRRQLPKYEYPEAVLTAAKVNWFAAHHTPYRLHRDECVPIAKLDAQGDNGIFGGGLLLSQAAAAERAAAERAAAERAAAERAAAERDAATRWKLSPRELEMQRMIGTRERK